MEKEITKPSVRRQITTLLGLLTVGILSGVVLTGYFLYYYNPSGRYQAGHVLLEPALVSSLSFVESTHERGPEVRHLFDSIVFSYYDTEQHREIQQPVTLDQYMQFYGWLANDVSLETIDKAVIASFDLPGSAHIILNVHPEYSRDSIPSTTVFQMVTLAVKDDYYRIQLHTASSGTSYAYFHHPGLWQRVSQLMKLSRE